MPLAINKSVHLWIKEYRSEDKPPDKIPVDPEKMDLLGFPGVELEHTKVYIRRLWLASANDRIQRPRFLNHNVTEMVALTNKVVNRLVNDANARFEGLQSEASPHQTPIF
jgi:hypothetical protein